MKYCLVLLFFAFFSWKAFGQEATVREDTVAAAQILTPEYPGGSEALEQYLVLNLRYPCDAMAKKIEGEVVVNFIIGEDGRVRDITLSKKLGYGCEEEAERVVKNMPAWKPATRNGKAIAVQYRLPVVFELPL